jgi:hypothetical protein
MNATNLRAYFIGDTELICLLSFVTPCVDKQ